LIKNNIYKIEMIIEHQREIDNQEYLVKWKGCTDLTWIYKKDILSKKVIVNYWKAEGQ
jgi:hypothetical protein